LIYLDTNVVAPFYWAEALSDAVDELFRQETELCISQLGEIERNDAQSIADRFQSDLGNGFYRQFALEAVHYEIARDWIKRFDTPLRTLDALHLAIAASYDIPLVTVDEGLVVSADLLGVDIRILRPDD
jgi:uncharacterized protein